MVYFTMQVYLFFLFFKCVYFGMLKEIYKKLSLEKTSFPSHTFVLKCLALTNQSSLKKD